MSNPESLKDSSIYLELISKADSIIKHEPEEVNVLFCKALILEFKGLHNKSIATYKKILQIDSTHSAAYYNIAASKLNQFKHLTYVSKYSNETYSNEEPFWNCEDAESDCLKLAEQILPLINKSIMYDTSAVREDLRFFAEMKSALETYIDNTHKK